MAKRVNENWLIFVDTNIWLDFYRKEGTDAITQIEALKKHAGNLILTDQVLMEFLKNRQKIISTIIRELKKPEAFKVPAILAESQSVATANRNLNNFSDDIKKINIRVRRLLAEPKRFDQAYKGCCQIFEHQGIFTLNKKLDNDMYYAVEAAASKRFARGYPPRKSDDTSFGDAINWEWIVKCAQLCKSKSNVMIVTRDSDYGLRNDKEFYLNDFLEREFKERVSRERKIVLTARLTDALKKLNEQVSREEIKRETLVIGNSFFGNDSDISGWISANEHEQNTAIEGEA